MRRTALPVVLCLFFLGSPSVAQEPAAQDPAVQDPAVQDSTTGELQLQTFEDLVEVSEVFVDVLATADGEPVLGLGMDDFVIEEDGEPVELTSVGWYTTRYGDGPEAGSAASDHEVPTSRYLIFFFHDQTRFGLFGNRMMRQQLRAGRDARRWIAEDMSGSDWAAVVGYDTELRIHQDFTQDLDALATAVDRVITGKKPRSFEPGRREARERGRELGILSRLPAGRELHDSAENVYQAIERVAEATGFLTGRKILLLYTLGFGVERGFGRTSLPDPRYYPQLEPVLNDHNVAVYPLDMTPPGSALPQEDFLQKLADDTGGVYDPNIIGFHRPLQEIAEENSGYYLITYRSARPAGEIGYQRLTVRAKDPEIQIRARTGYRYGL